MDDRDKLMRWPDVEPEPDDHLGCELGSGLMWVSEPDVEPGWDESKWMVSSILGFAVLRLTKPTIKALKMILRTSHAISWQIRARTSLSTTISMMVTAFLTTIHAISMTINAIQPGQMKICNLLGSGGWDIARQWWWQQFKWPWYWLNSSSTD